jgi:hypothetical protein
MPEPSGAQKIDALETALGGLIRKVDGMATARMDSADAHRREDDDARIAKLVSDAVAAALKAHDDARRRDRHHREDDGDLDIHHESDEPEEGEEGEHKSEPAPMSADDNRLAGDDSPDRRDFHREDDRRDKRADAMRRQQGDENDRLTAQYEYDRAFQAVKGERAPQPISGQSARSYRLYCMKPLQKYSDAWKDVNLERLPSDAFRLADAQIRADAIRIGNDSSEMQRFEGAKAGALLREIRKQDRAGRIISEFVGPTDAVNGMFTPFRQPAMRAKFDMDLVREARREMYRH